MERRKREMLCKERKVEQSAVSVWRTAPKNASKMKFLIVVALLKLCESETGRMGYTIHSSIDLPGHFDDAECVLF